MIHAGEAGVNIGNDPPTKIKYKLFDWNLAIECFLVTGDGRKFLAKLIFEIHLQIQGNR